MKHFLVLFALAAVSSASVWKGGLRIRWDIGINFGGTFFFDIPRSLTNAISEGWTWQTQPDGLPVTSVSMYCYSDLVVCCFYDPDGYVAGVQVAVPHDKFVPYYPSMDAVGFTNWTVNGRSYYTAHQYFTTDEEILSSRHLRENENKIIENGGVWVVGTNKEVVQIANTTAAIVDEGLFTIQACMPWMGRHYFYNMSSTTSCTEPLFPWFILVESGELIGTGLMFFGTLTLDDGARNWFEDAGLTALEAIIPDHPDCMNKMTEVTPGISMHIYYIDQPWLISCIFQ